MSGQTGALTGATIEWREGRPYSPRYGDMYHAADGAAEVQQLFLSPLGFPERLAERRLWTIGELGFGTGLNFAVFGEQIRRQADCRAHFISFERHPLAPADFRALARTRTAEWPIYAELAAGYPPLEAGWQRRLLLDGRLVLSLYWGDAAAGLADILDRQRQPVDAWLLDGFAPDRNPELWADEICRSLAALSGPGTRLATFTAAGRVRRSLAAVGFHMQRLDQRPRKRESLAGSFTGPGLTSTPTPDRVRIAGAGLAGASTARQLADAGVMVEVFDPAGIAGGTSGMPRALQHGRLLADGSAVADWRYHAMAYARAYCAGRSGVWPLGILQSANDAQAREKLERTASRYGPTGDWLQSVAEAGDLVPALPSLRGPALYFPEAAVVEPAVLCADLLNHPGIQVHRQALAPEQAISDPDMPCVLAAGAAVRDWPAARYLEIAPLWGQIDWVALQVQLPIALAGSHYLVPDPANPDGLVSCGATYEYQPWEETRASLANVKQLAGLAFARQGCWRGIRAVSSDRMPAIGRLTGPDGTPVPGLLVTAGHGSTGTLSAHLGGAIVTAQLLGWFEPVTRPVLAAVAPHRFHLRQARRGFRHGVKVP